MTCVTMSQTTKPPEVAPYTFQALTLVAVHACVALRVSVNVTCHLVLIALSDMVLCTVLADVAAVSAQTALQAGRARSAQASVSSA